MQITWDISVRGIARSLVISLISACALALVAGCAKKPARVEGPPRPEWRALLVRASTRAAADSLALARASVDAVGSMKFEFGREGEKVHVDDRLRLTKKPGMEFSTEPIAHVVAGDTTLLKDMYTFKDSKGNTRGQQSAQLTGLSFGASFLPLLHTLLAGDDDAGYTLRDSAADIGGVPCYLFTFTTGERSGRFWIDRDSCGLRKLEIEQESNYLVGGYKYRMTTVFQREPGGDRLSAGDSVASASLLLPVRTSSSFEYSRLATSGTGAIEMALDSISVR
jgi:hypothetical protein